MSIFKKLEQKTSNPNEKMLGKALLGLVDELKQITEFGERELKILSLFSHDNIIQELLLEYYLPNKKHRKRKHAPEILKAMKYIAKSIGSQNPLGLGLGFGNFNQERR